MKNLNMVAWCLLGITLSACQHTARVVEVPAEHLDFELSINDQGLPAGWQAHINDGYQLSMDAGFHHDSHALKMDGMAGGKAVMLYQKTKLDQAVNARFVLTGHLATADLKGEAALYFRAFSDGQLIHQDDMRAYALSGNRPWSEVAIRSPLLQAVTEVEFGVLAMGQGIAWVDDLSLQQNRSENTSRQARQYANQALELIESNSIYAIESAVEQRFLTSLQGAQVVADVHGSLVQLLHEMGDQHASFMPAEVVNKQHAEVSEAATEKQQIDEVPSSEHRLPAVGHIMIPGFSKATGDATAYVAAAQSVYAAGMANARCGWVVDLRGNSGGSMWPMLAAVAPLMADEVVGYMLDSRAGVSPWRVTNEAVMLGDVVKQPLGYDRMALHQALLTGHDNLPIVLLLDGNTASSAEAVAMAFKGQDGVTFMGEQSSGYTTGISQVELPDGSLVRLSIAHFADRNQQLHQQGLMPDVTVDAKQPLLDQAHQYLTSQASCRL